MESKGAGRGEPGIEVVLICRTLEEGWPESADPPTGPADTHCGSRRRGTVGRAVRVRIIWGDGREWCETDFSIPSE
eukprot:349934-Pyramimonas_sp.AAC.1